MNQFDDLAEMVIRQVIIVLRDDYSRQQKASGRPRGTKLPKGVRPAPRKSASTRSWINPPRPEI